MILYKQHITTFITLFLVLGFASDVFGQRTQRTIPQSQENAEMLRQLEITEKLGEQIPGDILVTNENGEEVLLSSYFESGKPVLLNLIYFNCPSLCSLILNGVADAVDKLRWTPGEEYEVVTLSIDPDEDYTMAADQKRGYLSRMDRDGIEDGWHFLTTDQENIDRITEAVGMPFVWSDEAQEFLHGSAIMFVSPDMKLTRYLYGVSYRELDVRNALFDAAGGKVGSTMERIALYCFTYDAESRSYVPYAMNIMKVGGVIILLSLGLLIGIFWLKDRNKKSSEISFDE